MANHGSIVEIHLLTNTFKLWIMTVTDKKYILLIDDDADVLKLLEIKLLREGYQVKTLLHGFDLLDTVSESRPDLIVMDVNMPYIAGSALCKILKNNASTATVPIIMFSGNENVEKISSTCGADGFLTKPCDPASLVTAVRSYF
ncbi:MAG: response regulator [Chitinophagaceae bacterium]|nr:MAG: response regulator [Chitinophagaceae bacterium]